MKIQTNLELLIDCEIEAVISGDLAQDITVVLTKKGCAPSDITRFFSKAELQKIATELEDKARALAEEDVVVI